MRKLLLILPLLLFTPLICGQTPRIDSLKKVLKTYGEDTNRVKTLNLLGANAGLDRNEYDTTLYYTRLAIKLAKKLNYQVGLSKSYAVIGNAYFYKGNIQKALKNYLASLKALKRVGDKVSVAKAYNNVGLAYAKLGNQPKALEYYLMSLKMKKEMGNKKGMAASYGNIGIVYAREGDNSKALQNFRTSLKIKKEIGDKKGIGISYNNVGLIYSIMDSTDKALKNYLAALKIAKEIGDKIGIALAYDNIGGEYAKQNEFNQALKNYLSYLRIGKEVGARMHVATAYNSIANLYLNENKNNLAQSYFRKSLKIAKEIGVKRLISINYEGLATAENNLGNYKSAYKNYKMYIVYLDSLKNKENTKKITQLQMQFKFDQQQVVDSIAHAKEKEISAAQIAQQEAEISVKKNQQYALFGGLALVLVFAIFMYNRFKKTQKQKQIIEIQKEETERQKELVDTKNKEISDSITYAKRIQEAILPSRFSLSENLENGFIFFKPKDIVSGDFYWLEKVGDTTFIAAADCTGHGVPGAMVSVICSNALSKALLEEKITETGKLLDRTRELVVERFAGSGEDVKDGMDISLCKIADNKLQWSGANNPLWIVRKSVNSATKPVEVEEIKPDKQPIGKTDNALPFTTHNIQLQQGDAIYIFTDGYADQFGGERGKKFKYKPFKELVLSLQGKDRKEQKIELEKAFMNWKGDLEQVDDVCVIGIRIV